MGGDDGQGQVVGVLPADLEVAEVKGHVDAGADAVAEGAHGQQGGVPAVHDGLPQLGHLGVLDGLVAAAEGDDPPVGVVADGGPVVGQLHGAVHGAGLAVHDLHVGDGGPQGLQLDLEVQAGLVPESRRGRSNRQRMARSTHPPEAASRANVAWRGIRRAVGRRRGPVPVVAAVGVRRALR